MSTNANLTYDIQTQYVGDLALVGKAKTPFLNLITGGGGANWMNRFASCIDVEFPLAVETLASLSEPRAQALLPGLDAGATVLHEVVVGVRWTGRLGPRGIELRTLLPQARAEAVAAAARR